MTTNKEKVGLTYLDIILLEEIAYEDSAWLGRRRERYQVLEEDYETFRAFV